ncbi:hypothetical protein ABKV19_020708 [Rosa sericea]
MKKCGFEPDSVVFRMMIRGALCAAGKADVAMEFYKEMVQKPEEELSENGGSIVEEGDRAVQEAPKGL